MDQSPMELRITGSAEQVAIAWAGMFARFRRGVRQGGPTARTSAAAAFRTRREALTPRNRRTAQRLPGRAVLQMSFGDK